MNKHDYKQNAYYLMYLIRCVLNDNIPAKEKLDKMDLSGVFAVAKAHSLTAIAAYALESAGIYDKAFEEEKNKAIRKEIILDAERERVLAELEKAGIWYMPLKGIILKDFYPQIGMRQMGDNDFLIDNSRQEDIKNIMISCGFRVNSYNQSKHDVYHKEPVCNFQMHINLFEKNYDDPLYLYFRNVDRRLMNNTENQYGRFLTNEDFYIYIKAHEFKHYSTGGTGLRSIVDTYVYLREYNDRLDMKYIHNELKKLGIADYEDNNRKLALDLLDGKKLTPDEHNMLNYIVFSGTYGTVQNSVNNMLNNDKACGFAKIKLIIYRLLVPIRESDPHYKVYATRFKWFYKYKYRIPLLFFYRIGTALTSRRNRAKAELIAVLKAR